MGNRFYGNITIGGQVTKEQLKALIALVDTLLEMDGTLEKNGQASFHECNSEDFADLIQYVEEQKIALQLYWDAGHECDAHCEVWLNGKYKQFNTDGEGNIVVRVSDLEEHENMFICDFIKSLDIPDFPAFELIEDDYTLVPKKILEYEFKTATRHGVIAARSWEEAIECLAQMLEDNPEDWGWVEDTQGKKHTIGEQPKRKKVTVFYSDGHNLTTEHIGTNDEIAKHFLGRTTVFNGIVLVALAVQIEGGYTQGLKIKSIETGEYNRIANTRLETVKIDDDQSYDEVILHLYDGNEHVLNDVWVYDLDDNWLNGIGYKKEFAK